MVEGGIMEDVVKTEMGEDPSMGDKNDQPFALFLTVIQSNGKPLPIGGFADQVMSQMLQEVVWVILKEVMVMNDQEVVMEFEDTPMIEVSMAIHGLIHWDGQSISVDSILAKKNLIVDIVRECEIGWERQRDLE